MGSTAAKNREVVCQFRVFIIGGRRKAIIERAMESCQRKDWIQKGCGFQLKRFSLKNGNKLTKGLRFSSWRVPANIIGIFHVVLYQLNHLASLFTLHN